MKKSIIEPVDNFDFDEYPIKLHPSVSTKFYTCAEKVYHCLNVDDVEYFVFANSSHTCFSIAAYAFEDGKRYRVGEVAYSCCDNGIYIHSIVVAKGYRRIGIGSNMLKIMLLISRNHIQKGKYVGAFPSASSGENALTQKELIAFYERRGIMCSGSADFNSDTVQCPKFIYRNLKRELKKVDRYLENGNVQKFCERDVKPKQ